jgi:phage tail sheath protein FI
MSASYSYPGIYIQELPLSAHTITPAPTSIAAFVGYAHPWKTSPANFNTAIQLFSFSDYEANFGGLYTSGMISSDLARAVYEFFLNGGTNAYVVALQPNAYEITASGLISLGTFGLGSGMISATAQIIPDSSNASAGMLVTALEPVDMVPMTVTVSNIRVASPPPAGSPVYNTFDMVISYGTRIETYRNLGIGASSGTAPDKAINGISSLISIAPITTGGSLGTSFAGGSATSAPPPISVTPALTGLPGTFATSFSAADFIGGAGAPGPFDTDSSLDKVEIFNLLLVPGVADNSVISAALAFAERKRAFTILDPPQNAPAAGSGSIDTLMTSFPMSQNGALYFPYLLSTDPVTSNPIAMAPGGYVAGVYAATDTSRGVWKAPAGIGTPLLDTVGPVATGVMNDMRQGVLNNASVNCLRQFNSIGTVVFGARTLVSANQAFAQSKYVPVRRMTLFIEQTLIANLKWVVFEPNDEPLWLAIRTSIEAFLLSLFNQQALQGSTPSQAFQVKCDATTTTSSDQQNGIVNIVVGVALLKPAEFVVIKIAQIAGQTAG